MPKLATYKNLIFYIVMFDLTERYHVHITNTKTGRQKVAKVWLDNLEVFEQGVLTDKEINLALELLKENKVKFIKQIEKVRGSERIKTLKF